MSVIACRSCPKLTPPTPPPRRQDSEFAAFVCGRVLLNIQCSCFGVVFFEHGESQKGAHDGCRRPMRTEKEKYLDGQQIGVINKIHSIHPCSPSMTTIAVAPVRHDESMLPTVRPSSVHVGLPDSRISTTESPSFPTTTSPKSFSDHSHLSSISATANELVPTDAWSSMSEVATPSSAQQETSTSAFAVETTTTASTPKAVSSPTISVVQDAKDSTLSKEASRFGDLERKRMGLVKMRVNLEQKLFEAKSSDESCSSSNKSSDTRESGRGNIIWPDGKSVTGQWHMGQLNGRCFFQWPSGETYDGDCLNGKKHGRGRFSIHICRNHKTLTTGG